MPLVLHQRIIETVFLMSVSEHLCPVSLPDITENSAAVILYLKGYQSAFRSHHQVNLRICAGSPPDIAVMKDSFWVDSHSKQREDSLPFRPFPTFWGRYTTEQPPVVNISPQAYAGYSDE